MHEHNFSFTESQKLKSHDIGPVCYRLKLVETDFAIHAVWKGN